MIYPNYFYVFLELLYWSFYLLYKPGNPTLNTSNFILGNNKERLLCWLCPAGLAVVMHGYPVSSVTGQATPLAPLTARRARVIDTFHDGGISRRMDISSKTINNNLDYKEFTADSTEGFDVVALLLAGSASPGMSGGPILRMTSNGKLHTALMHSIRQHVL